MKFNPKSETTKRKNFMGSTAYELNPKERLLQMAATCLLGERKYYGKVDKYINKTIKEVAKKDPEFVLQLAAYIRNQLYLRTISINLLVEASLIDACKPFVRKYTPLIVKRADELSETVAALQKKIGHIGDHREKGSMPSGLKKGLADAFHNFDEYQFGKYKKTKSSVKLKDVLKLVHPIPRNDDESAVYKRIKEDAIATPKTWEVEISTRGNKQEVWDELIENKKLPYMATLRNLRNLIKSGTAYWDKVLGYITNDKAIQNCRQLPHRFLSAWEAVETGSKSLFEKDVELGDKIKGALNTAIEKSAKMNIPRLDGKTIIICDNSGSARGDGGGHSRLSLKSVRTMADTGNLLGLLAWYSSENTIFGIFGDRLDLLRLNRDAGVLENFKKVNKAGEAVGQATEQGVFTMIQKMIKDKIYADRLIVCSDLQIGDGKSREYGLDSYETKTNKTVPKLLDEYREKVNPDLYYYSVCFGGYGDDVVDGSRRVLISGWSDKILAFIKAYETDKKTQVKEVKKWAEKMINAPKNG